MTSTRPAGTWLLRVDGGVEVLDPHWAALTAAGMLGTAEVDGHVDVYFPRKVDDLPLPGRWVEVADRDWHARWRARLRPVPAGRWTVTPSWCATGGDAEIVIDPGQAFGTGHHETTRRCLAALGELDLRGRRVLDVGTGSGVLAIAAARSGAGVVAVDVDPLAVDAARANSDRNGATVDVRPGSLDALRDATFDVVVANLDTATIVALAGELAARVAAGGSLLASGVTNERAATAVAALRAAGLAVSASVGHEWSLLRATRPGGGGRA